MQANGTLPGSVISQSVRQHAERHLAGSRPASDDPINIAIVSHSLSDVFIMCNERTLNGKHCTASANLVAARATAKLNCERQAARCSLAPQSLQLLQFFSAPCEATHTCPPARCVLSPSQLSRVAHLASSSVSSAAWLLICSTIEPLMLTRVLLVGALSAAEAYFQRMGTSFT